jgi:hypothetical protein
MPATYPEWVNLLTVDLRKVVSETDATFESMLPMLFAMDSTSQAEETDLSYSGLGDFQKFTGVANSDTMHEEYKKTVDFPEYMNSFPIQRRAYDDSKGKNPQGRGVFNMARELSLSFNRTKEKHGAEIFNYAFDATQSYSSGSLATLGDGKALCVNDHPSKAAATYAGDNLETTAFSNTAVEADRRAFNKVTDGKGNKVHYNMDMLLVPLELEEDAWELINTKGKINTANNNRNFHEGKYKLAVWNELTDTNNWFSIDSMKMKLYLWWITRTPFETFNDFVNKTQTFTFGGYARHSIMLNQWRWVRGHNVT